MTLIEHAHSTSVEEARTSAVIACKMIKEHRLLAGAVLPDRAELHKLANAAVERWLEDLWSHKSEGIFIPARKALDLMDPKPEPFLYDKLHTLVLRKARGLRAKGILLGQPGAGGFKIAPNVTCKRPRKTNNVHPTA